MSSKSDLDVLKRTAMSRNRKVIFDNDGGDAAQLCPGTSVVDLIGTRTKPALDAGIDTYIYTTGWGFGIGLHESNIGSILRTKDGLFAKSLVDDFAKAGTDCLRIVSEYVRKQGTEFFWGMRMNDTHDAGYDNVFMPENDFKNENPSVMFGRDAKYGAVTGVDYSDQRVREFAVSYIMDVVDNYQVDGIFLDFFRHPVFFRSNAEGKPATEEERRTLTSFVARVKEELNARSLAKGKYLLMAIRVPDSVEYARDIGIDLEDWLQAGLTDLLFTTSYLHLNEWGYSAQLGHKFDVPVYPSLDESRVRSVLPKHKRNSSAGYYGRIMNVWQSGCDGVFMFNNSGLRDMKVNIEQNWFTKETATFQEGLEATVRGKEFVNTLSKTYFPSVRGIGAVAGRALPHDRYINIPTLNHDAPIEVTRNGKAEVPVTISDDLQAAGQLEKLPKVTATMFIFGDAANLVVSCNGHVLRPITSVNERADTDADRTEYQLDADIQTDWIFAGTNTFCFEATKPITLLDLWVDLRYPD